jgi:hypothetical protein
VCRGFLLIVTASKGREIGNKEERGIFGFKREMRKMETTQVYNLYP